MVKQSVVAALIFANHTPQRLAIVKINGAYLALGAPDLYKRALAAPAVHSSTIYSPS